MSRFIGGVLPKGSGIWRMVGVCAILMAMLLPGPMIASADDGGKADGRVGPFITQGAVFIVSAGEQKRLYGNTFKTTGEEILGCVVSEWAAIPEMDPNPTSCSPAPGHFNLVVHHTSITTVDPTNGTISGRASGTFDILDGSGHVAFKGKYDGDISASYLPLPLSIPGAYFPSGFPKLLTKIKDNGTWNASNGKGDTAKGNFIINLDTLITLSSGQTTLMGSAVLTGTHNRHDN